MHVQIINFGLGDIDEEEYRTQVEPIAPAFAGLPGLVSKTWLANEETNTYGGVYVWREREAMETYKETDLYKGMLANPHLTGITVKDFSVLDGPTRITRGMVEADQGALAGSTKNRY
jgi:heme-degrading monooxygenase HmoA